MFSDTESPILRGSSGRIRRRSDAAHRLLAYLRGDRGQALVEAPYVIVITCVLVLILLQPAIWLYTKMMCNSAAGSLARMAVTDVDLGSWSIGDTSAHEGAVTEYVVDRKLVGLPQGEYFQNGTPEVLVTPGRDWVTAKVSVRQKPLPLVGLMAEPLGMAGSDGLVTITGECGAPGALRGIDAEFGPNSAPYWYGQKPEG